MKYAVYLPPFGPYADPRVLANLARAAEGAGWDGFFIWDHIAWGSFTVADPWVALAAVAAATERIRLGALVTPVARRRPWKLARETVTLDHLSDGRLTLGVGLGFGAREFDNFGEETDPKVRGAMLDEGLEVLTGLWRGKPFSYEGAYYHVKDAHFTPKPVQQPRIPIWVGGFWPNKPPFRRAARWDGMFPLLREEGPFDVSVEQVKDMLAYIHAHRESDAPFDMVQSNGNPDVDLGRDAETAARYAEAGVTWWFEQLNPWRFGWRNEGPWPAEAMRERVLAGPPRA